MAERRMFAKSVVSSDTFLDMNLSTQVLYFHLAMNADDDGFVTPKKIIRMTGTSESDLEILVSKGFVILFPSGVACIRHWKVNNLIRSDRYVETEYKAEMGQLKLVDRNYEEIGLVDSVGIDSEVLDTEGNNNMVYQRFTNGCQMVNQRLTQNRLGKDRVGKKELPTVVGSKKEKPAAFFPPTTEDVQAYLDELEVKSFDAGSFCDFYSSKGWMVGRNRMKDWKAAVRTWIRQDREKGIDPAKPREEQRFAHPIRSARCQVVQRDVTSQYADDVPEEVH